MKKNKFKDRFMGDCKKHGRTEFRMEKQGSKSGQGLYARCCECQRLQNIKKRIQRQAYACSLIKNRGATCQRCGYEEYPEILQWHHTDPEKKSFEISQAIQGHRKGVTKDMIEEEVELCELLCPNCHFKHHTGYSYHELMESTNQDDIDRGGPQNAITV